VDIGGQKNGIILIKTISYEFLLIYSAQTLRNCSQL